MHHDQVVSQSQEAAQVLVLLTPVRAGGETRAELQQHSDPRVPGARVAHQSHPGSWDQAGVQQSRAVQRAETGRQVGGNLELLELL